MSPMHVSGGQTVVNPWYRQFYLRRGDAPWASDRISKDGYEAHLEAVEGFVCVSTEMYGSPTPVSIEIHDSEPVPVENADRSVEVSVDGDGPIAVLSWAEEEASTSIDTPDGPLRLRVSWFGLSETIGNPAREAGGEAESPERILLQVWPPRYVGGLSCGVGPAVSDLPEAFDIAKS